MGIGRGFAWALKRRHRPVGSDEGGREVPVFRYEHLPLPRELDDQGHPGLGILARVGELIKLRLEETLHGRHVLDDKCRPFGLLASGRITQQGTKCSRSMPNETSNIS